MSVSYRYKIKEIEKIFPYDENSCFILNNFHVWHKQLIIFIMLYITSLVLIYLITESLYLWQPSSKFPSPTSWVAQKVKNLPVMQETWVWSLGWKDLLEKRMATHSSILAWRIPWTEKPGRLYSSWSRKESDMTEQLIHKTQNE